MNEIVNKLSLAEDKFMPEMHLRQPGFTYTACEPFSKNKERIQKFKETGDSRYIYHSKLDIVCNWIRTRNHLVHKRTLNHLAKLAK